MMMLARLFAVYFVVLTAVDRLFKGVGTIGRPSRSVPYTFNFYGKSTEVDGIMATGYVVYDKDTSSFVFQVPVVTNGIHEWFEYSMPYSFVNTRYDHCLQKMIFISSDQCRFPLHPVDLGSYWAVIAMIEAYCSVEGWSEVMQQKHNQLMHAMNGNMSGMRRTKKKLDKREIARLEEIRIAHEQLVRKLVRVPKQVVYEKNEDLEKRYAPLEVDGVLADVVEALVYNKPPKAVLDKDGKPFSGAQFRNQVKILEHKLKQMKIEVVKPQILESVTDYGSKAITYVREAFKPVMEMIENLRALAAVSFEIAAWVRNLDKIIAALISAICDILVVIWLIQGRHWTILVTHLVGKFALLHMTYGTFSIENIHSVIEQMKSVYDENTKRSIIRKDGVDYEEVHAQAGNEMIVTAFFKWAAAIFMPDLYDSVEVTKRAEYLTKNMQVLVTGRSMVRVVIEVISEAYSYVMEKKHGIGMLSFIDDSIRLRIMTFMTREARLSALDPLRYGVAEEKAVKSLMEEAIALESILVQSKEPAANLAPFLQSLTRARVLQTNILARFGTTPSRPACSQFKFIGAPGIGKSFAMLDLSKKAMTAFDEMICTDAEVYSRNPDDKYWDGLKANKRLMCCDDCFQSQDVDEIRAQALMEIAIGSNAPYALVIANLAGKVGTNFELPLSVGSMNEVVMRRTLKITSPEAWARRQVFIYVELAPGVETVHRNGVTMPLEYKKDFSHLRFWLSSLELDSESKEWTLVKRKVLTPDDTVLEMFNDMEAKKKAYEALINLGEGGKDYINLRMKLKETKDKGKEKEEKKIAVSSVPSIEVQPQMLPAFTTLKERFWYGSKKEEPKMDQMEVLHAKVLDLIKPTVVSREFILKNYSTLIQSMPEANDLPFLIAQSIVPGLAPPLVQKQMSLFETIKEKVTEISQNPAFLPAVAIGAALTTIGVGFFVALKYNAQKEEETEAQGYEDGNPKDRAPRMYQGRRIITEKVRPQADIVEYKNTEIVQVLGQVGLDKGKLDQLTTLLKNVCSVELLIDCENSIHSVSCLGLFMFKRCLSIPGHTYGLLKDRTFDITIVRNGAKYGPYASRDLTITIQKHADGFVDQCGINFSGRPCRNMPEAHDITPYFPETMTDSMFVDVFQVIPGTSFESTFFNKLSHVAPRNVVAQSTVNGVKFYELKTIETDGMAANGLCHSVYITMNPKIKYLVTGLHFAEADNKRALIQPMTKDRIFSLFSEFPEPDMDPKIIGVSAQIEIPSYAKVPKRQELLGVVEKEYQTFPPNKDKHKMSATFDIEHNPMGPAQLRPFVKDGVKIDPKQKAVDKWDVRRPPLEERSVKYLDTAAKLFAEEFANIDAPRDGPLTDHEALNTLVEYDKKTVDMNSSAGSYCKAKFKGVGKHGIILVKDEVKYLRPGYADLVHELENEFGRGRLVHMVNEASLKMECRLHEKNNAGKTRMYQAGNAPIAHIETKYVGPFEKSVMNKLNLGFAIEIDPTGRSWLVLRDRITKFSHKIWSFDIESNDCNFCFETLAKAIDLIIDWLRNNAHYNERELLITSKALESELYPVLAYDNVAVVQPGVLASGTRITLLANTLGNALEARATLLYLLNKNGYPADREHLEKISVCVHFGDDMMVGPNPAYPWLTADAFVESYYELFKRKLTMTNKDGRPVADLPIEEAQFISRGFEIHDGECFAPLKETSCYNISNYYLDNGTGHAKQSCEGVEAALREWFQHGKQRFNAEKKRLNDLLIKAGLPRCELSYDSLLIARSKHL